MWLSRVVPKGMSEPGCFPFLHSGGGNTAKALGCPGHSAADCPMSQAAGQAPPPHAGCFCVGITLTGECGHGARCVHVFITAAHTLTHCVSRPTGGIRNSQIFKAVSVFSVYMLDFIMVHGQKRFSTSHTFKEKTKMTPVSK